jgi:hypothetical protein
MIGIGELDSMSLAKLYIRAPGATDDNSEKKPRRF